MEYEGDQHAIPRVAAPFNGVCFVIGDSLSSLIISVLHLEGWSAMDVTSFFGSFRLLYVTSHAWDAWMIASSFQSEIMVNPEVFRCGTCAVPGVQLDYSPCLSCCLSTAHCPVAISHLWRATCSWALSVVFLTPF